MSTGCWLSIIGIGEDGLPGLSPTARTLITHAALVVGGRRHLALAAEAVTGDTLAWPSPPRNAFPAILARRGSPVAVLASGDPFFYGIGSLLAAEIPSTEMMCLPAPSAFSLAANRLGWALQDCTLVTLHGRALERIVPHLQPRARILALSWDGTTPRRLADLLTRHGFTDATLTVCEALGGPRERLIKVAQARRMTEAHPAMMSYATPDFDPLNLVAIEIREANGARVIPLTPGIPDDWFEHDGQLTKQDIRALTLAALQPRRGETLWDVGAGSGSVGIEWMLTDPANRAVAIERDPTRANRIARNAASLGVPDLSVVVGPAPSALQNLPPPDAVFIGGGATTPGTIETAWAALPSGGRLVVNAVTLETQAVLIDHVRNLGGSFKTIQIACADPVGRFHGMRPAMPVTQWAVTKP